MPNVEKMVILRINKGVGAIILKELHRQKLRRLEGSTPKGQGRDITASTRAARVDKKCKSAEHENAHQFVEGSEFRFHLKQSPSCLT